MKKLLLVFSFSGFFFFNSLIAQVTPSIEWEKSFGGTQSDEAYSLQQTNDKGFVVAGFSVSNDGDVTGNHGAADYWIVKLDSTGSIIWQKSFGGTEDDVAQSIQQTTDSGYIIAGFTLSNNYDVTGNHGDRDYWILKLDKNGILEWQKCLGGTGDDIAYSIQQTSDGGFIVAGSSNSNDGDVSGNHGGYYTGDYWIVRLDSSGNIVGKKCWGGSDEDCATTVTQTLDGGFIIAGWTLSNNGNVSGNHGNGDYWIIKLNAGGNLEWQKCFGGTSNEGANSIQQTPDGGFIIAGDADSNDGDVTGFHGVVDYWILKLDSGGNLIWQKCLGGYYGDEAHSIRQGSDATIVVAGESASNDGDVSGNHVGSYNNSWDYWIADLDSDGNLIWEKSLGGSNSEYANAIQPTDDGGIVIAGLAASTDGDVTGNHGIFDYWIVKLSDNTATNISSLTTRSISLSPNPVQNLLTINLATPASEVSIRVYDLQGKIISLPTTIQNTAAQLNTDNLPAGFYTLQIINNKTGEREAGKFVKE